MRVLVVLVLLALVPGPVAALQSVASKGIRVDPPMPRTGDTVVFSMVFENDGDEAYPVFDTDFVVGDVPIGGPRAVDLPPGRNVTLVSPPYRVEPTAREILVSVVMRDNATGEELGGSGAPPFPVERGTRVLPNLTLTTHPADFYAGDMLVVNATLANRGDAWIWIDEIRLDGASGDTSTRLDALRKRWLGPGEEVSLQVERRFELGRALLTASFTGRGLDQPTRANAERPLVMTHRPAPPGPLPDLRVASATVLRHSHLPADEITLVIQNAGEAASVAVDVRVGWEDVTIQPLGPGESATVYVRDGEQARGVHIDVFGVQPESDETNNVDDLSGAVVKDAPTASVLVVLAGVVLIALTRRRGR